MYTNRIAVILLNWRNYSDTLECIYTLVSSGIDLGDIIVVDNDSQDESVNIIRRSVPGIEVLESGRNGGFAYGCNVGIRVALERNYPYIWLLNNDTLVNKQTLSEMLNIFSKPANREIGIVGSLIRYLEFPYEIQALGGGSINYLTGQTKNILEFGDIDRLDYITGASMLVSRRVFERIGLLDERYFMYWEDVEFCIRAKNSGFGIAVATNSLVLHKESASLGPQSITKTHMIDSSQRIFFYRYGRFPAATLFVNRSGRALKGILRYIFSRIHEVYHNGR